MPARPDGSLSAPARLVSLVIAACAVLLAPACDDRPREPSAPRVSAPTPSAPAEQPDDLAPAASDPSRLCARLEEERAALDLGAPLRARVVGFDARARAWLSRDAPPAPLAAALEALLADPRDLRALETLQTGGARAFASAPELRVDASLVALTALDAAPPTDSNEAVRALLARARTWHPGEPAIPWIEALLVPELGGRRARLEEALAAGARDPALVLALARARLRDGDAEGTLHALAALPPTDAGTPDTQPLGSALRERADAVQRLVATQRAHELRGVRVWAGPALPDEVAGELALAVRAALDEAAATLGAGSRAELVVWVHDDVDALAAATCGAAWSSAIYDGSLHVVLPAARLDDALRASVRHESFHAQLDALTPLAPRWLHEGAAQRFAREPLDRDLLGARHVTRATDLRELDTRLGPDRSGADAGRAYALARAAVDELCERAGEAALADAVAALRAGVPPRELPERLGFAIP